ncbi:MAG: LPS export ABC transporter permease LptG [Oligoflexia bacterium]|nr:LPS export ABC transporter permease LptG [Oligoflexia bacterium]
MSILDRYIAKEFWKGFIAALVTFLVLYLGGDTVRQGFKEEIPPAYAFQYSLFQIPEVLVLLLPAASLMGTLVCLSGFARRNELTAMFASGISLARISLVILSLVFTLCCLSFVVTDRIIPPLAKAKTNFYRTVIQNRPDLQSDIRQNKIWYRSKNYIYNLRTFDPKENIIQGISIYTFDNNFNLLQQIEAKSAEFKNSSWILYDGFLTLFDKTSNYPLSTKFKSHPIHISESPADFKEIEKEVETLRLKNLWKYIQRTKEAGIDTKSYEVTFWSKISLALVPLIMTILGIPFSTQHHRSSSVARDIALCFLLVLIYWIFFSSLLSMGKNGWVSPFLAAWIPNIIFFFLGLLMITKSKRA